MSRGSAVPDRSGQFKGARSGRIGLDNALDTFDFVAFLHS
ncbi:MAG: hypothetical protein ACI9AO_001229, partial [Ilumatobacter sp.]